jgi:DNA-directed RNA polymerase subunit RPC12/RpoP
MYVYRPHVCPHCRSGRVERLPRHGVVGNLARLFRRRLYRCLKCGARFYDRASLRRAS